MKTCKRCHADIDPRKPRHTQYCPSCKGIVHREKQKAAKKRFNERRGVAVREYGDWFISAEEAQRRLLEYQRLYGEHHARITA